MYEYVDQAVTDLDEGGRFLVWSMRSWVCACSMDRCPARTLGPAFARWKMIGGLQPFHKAMLVLNHNSLEKFYFCNLNCNHISEHEAILLSLVRTLGKGEILAARETLAMLVEDDWVGDCLAAATGLTQALDEAGIAPGAPRTPARTCDTGTGNPPKSGT